MGRRGWKAIFVAAVIVAAGVGVAALSVVGAAEGSNRGAAGVGDPQDYRPLSPVRLLDTRSGRPTIDGQHAAGGAVGPGVTRFVPVLGRGEVPASGVAAVVLNVTATQPSAGGHLTVFPSGTTRPLSSDVNFTAGQTIANQVIAKVGADGRVAIFNASGNTHVIADVAGWFPSQDAATTPTTPAPPPTSPPVDPTPVVVPNATTSTYSSDDVTDASLGPSDSTIVELAPGTPPPAVGGQVALAPSRSLPHGMFGKVVAVSGSDGSGSEVALLPAAIDDVYDNVQIDFDGPVLPELVDDAGEPISAVPTDGFGAARIAGAASTRGMWSCESNGSPVNVEDLFDEGIGEPIKVRFENTHASHEYNSGALFTEPWLSLRLSGEVVYEIGHTVDVGFKCELSPAFRRTHRWMFRVGSVGPVPVSFFIEPALSFEVSAGGRLALSQRQYFAVSLRKQGLDQAEFRLAHSRDPVQLDASVQLSASAFAGGDLSLMVGAGIRDKEFSAGIYGTFGPRAELVASSARPGCMQVNGNFEADLGVRLNMWSKRWNVEVAELSSASRTMLGPWCLPGAGGPGAGGPGDSDPGAGGPGDSDPSPPPPPISQVTVGARHSCALRAVGTVTCWGNNSSGELGDGSTTTRHVAMTVPGLTDVVDIAAGASHTCAVRVDGALFCWGQNSEHQLGDGTIRDRRLPTLVLSGVQSVSLGTAGTCAVMTDTTLRCWGRNTFGQVGNATTARAATPQAVVGLTAVRQASVGGDHTCAVLLGGGARCWGRNAITPSGGIECIVTDDNSPKAACWGDSTPYNLLADGTNVERHTPVPVVGLSGVRSISTAKQHTCALLESGSVRCWGRGIWGRLGSGANHVVSTPMVVLGVANADELSTGEFGGCVLRAGGSVSCWGVNDFAWQSANPRFFYYASPQGVVPLTDIVSVSRGQNHGCAAQRSGTVLCWGEGPEALGVPNSGHINRYTYDPRPVSGVL